MPDMFQSADHVGHAESIYIGICTAQWPPTFSERNTELTSAPCSMHTFSSNMREFGGPGAFSFIQLFKHQALWLSLADGSVFVG